MNKLVGAVLMTLSFEASCDITSRAQADEFLDGYCIAIVNEIHKAVEKQKVQASKEDWQGFSETGAWIGGLADIYSKLCK